MFPILTNSSWAVKVGISLLLFQIMAFPPGLSATELVLKDGRILKGRIAPIVGLAELPQRPGTEGMEPPLILLIDDDLHRTFIPKSFVQEVREDDPKETEARFTFLYQTVKHGGLAVKSVGPALRVQPFDEFGRRTYTMYGNRGSVDVIQGITELTPQWAKVEGISHVWDMRIATSSIPRDTLRKILNKQVELESQANKNNPIESGKSIARFLMLAGYYEDARKTLEDLAAAFPDKPELKDDVAPTIRLIRQLSAQRIKSELELRGAAGQHRLAYEKLQQFPSEGVTSEILQGVRDMIQAYDAKIARRTKILEQIDLLIPKISSTLVREQIKKIRDEIAAEVTFDTLDRFAAFVQSRDDPDMTAEEKLAQAISGWLLGKDAAVVKLTVALSAYNVREKIRRYVNEPVKLAREQIFGEFAKEEAAAPPTVVDILANMKPPQELPKPVSNELPGYFRIETPGLPGQAPIVYWVQLPPEYSPYRAYPTIVTLHGAGISAEAQLSWWAGDWAAPPTAQDPDKRSPSVEQAADEEVEKDKAKSSTDETAKDSKTSDAAGPQPIPNDRKDGSKTDNPEKNPTAPKHRLGQAARHGYIVIAPEWTEQQQRQYEYSDREHAAVMYALRDACRRFAINTDRVYLSGHSMGGNAVWDIGLAHPDLWAGVIPVSAKVDKYCSFYSQNAKYVPFYIVLGELDGDMIKENAPQMDRYLRYNYPTTVVEFQGRGHEDFYDEILRMFNWMSHQERNFYPKEFRCSSLRDSDTFFWWIEVAGLPSKTRVDSAAWPPPPGVQPFQIAGMITRANSLNATARAGHVTVWVSPKMLDFQQKASVNINGRKVNAKDPFIKGDLRTLLEDVRTRGDRRHPFWARFDVNSGQTK